MNDSNFNDMLKKAQEMINNNQVPEEIKEMASKLGNSSGVSNSNKVGTGSGTTSNKSSSVNSKNLDASR